MKEVYDEIYNVENQKYVYRHDYKIDLLKEELATLDKSKKIIDVGCGAGYFIRQILEWGYVNSIGVEFSSTCSANYLNDVPHINADFLKYGQTIPTDYYDFCLCTDVLEHIHLENIDQMIKNLHNCAPHALLGVANHSSIVNGVELHVIRENSSWWRSKLEEYYPTVELVTELPNGMFFMFRCKAERH